MQDSPRLGRQGRLAENQTIFRNVNERIEKLNETFSLVLPIGEFVCECSNEECTNRIELTVEEYEAVRADPRRFAVTPAEDHVYLDVERVVERHPGYWVVEKFGPSADLARARDPRSRQKLDP